MGVGRLDFACQYPLVTAATRGIKSYPADSDPVYDSCWQRLREAHASTLVRTDVGMEVLWPSNGDLVFFSEDLNRYPASAFVTDSLGLTPPGTGFHTHIIGNTSLPSASFRLRPNGPIVAVPTTLVKLSISYQDPLTAPLTYAAGSVKWTSTVKRTRRALKEITTQWVVLSGLKKHGFVSDWAVLNLPVTSGAISGSGMQEKIPFVTETSRALPDSLVWWGPTDVPGLLTAGAARAATFPELHDRVAMLNRVLIIDPNQSEALMVLSRHLYAHVLREAIPFHKLTVKDPALALVVNEHFWNIYAQSTRMDLSLGMEMGGFDKPTTADYLYRMLSAMRTLAMVRPEQLDNRFRLGVAYAGTTIKKPRSRPTVPSSKPSRLSKEPAEPKPCSSWPGPASTKWLGIASLMTQTFVPPIKMPTRPSRSPTCRSINLWPSTPKPTACCSPRTETIGRSWSG